MTKIERARKLHARGMNSADIGRALGVPRTTVYYWLASSARVVNPRPTAVPPIIIPPEVLEDRDHRSDLAPRNLTAAFCGDPLPGYSALERR